MEEYDNDDDSSNEAPQELQLNLIATRYIYAFVGIYGEKRHGRRSGRSVNDSNEPSANKQTNKQTNKLPNDKTNGKANCNNTTHQ
jgi:hypothetical protein